MLYGAFFWTSTFAHRRGPASVGHSVWELPSPTTTASAPLATTTAPAASTRPRPRAVSDSATDTAAPGDTPSTARSRIQPKRPLGALLAHTKCATKTRFIRGNAKKALNCPGRARTTREVEELLPWRQARRQPAAAREAYESQDGLTGHHRPGVRHADAQRHDVRGADRGRGWSGEGEVEAGVGEAVAELEKRRA